MESRIMQRIVFSFVLMLIAASVTIAAEWQNRVERILWVVSDTQAVTRGWEHLGLFVGSPANVQTLTTGSSGSAREQVQWTVSRVGDTIADFVEPRGGSGIFSSFHARHKDGVMALVHRVGGDAELASEITRMASLGVRILLEHEVADSQGKARLVLFDTEAHGKYVLGLIAVSGAYPAALSAPPVPAKAARVTQYAFAIRDMDAVSAYWEKLGWPAMSVTNPDLLDLEYRGKAASFAMVLGWYRHTKVPYEWILSTKEPNVYADHMRVHGEGVHHLAFNVEDMDAAIAEWNARGFPTSQSGAWGERGKPGSGRFAYQDTQRIGGIDIELLWSYRAAKANE